MLSYTSSQTVQQSNEKYVIQGSFPSYYYPTAFSKQPNYPLSPRQEDALQRIRDSSNNASSGIVQTPASTPRSSIVPRFLSENRRRDASIASSTASSNSYSVTSDDQSHPSSQNYHQNADASAFSPYKSSENGGIVREIPVHLEQPTTHPASKTNNHQQSHHQPSPTAPEPPVRSSAPVSAVPSPQHSRNQVPANYLQFVAAPASNTPSGYGNYPELTGSQPKLAVPSVKQTSQKFQLPEVCRPQYYYEEDVQPNATMETKVTGQGQPKRVGRWTLAQLRQTDGIIPSQAGWNKGDSQRLMTNFGSPRNTSTRVKAENLQEVPEEILNRTHGEVRLQSGTNKYSSQRGMTGFGAPRDVCREGRHVNTNPADLQELPEEKIRLSEGIVRLQAGTNKYDSQKGMVGFGTARRETTKMVDSKHPEYSHEASIDQSQIPLQSGTNKFASQKGMMGFGTARRETTKMVDTNHPEYSHEASIDQTTIPCQMGSNKYASQRGMTGFGQPRWEVLDPSISWQNRKSQGMVRLQSGTNRFASQQGMTGFGTCRNTTYEAEGGELPYESMKISETIIPSQAGWNKGDSQKQMTSFGASRDVKGKHLKRIWELEYPEEAEVSLDRL